MFRALIEEFLLFVLPFCVFAGYLVIRKRNPLKVESWSGSLFSLAVIGFVLAISSLLYAGLSAKRFSGAYDPPHMEKGELVPGRFNDRP
jgi:phosphoglycerol transferase MdoB-like AlkP superfamily enzyme